MKDPKVLHILHQPTQINHRVSVVLPDDEERLTFGGDVMQKKVTDTPTWACLEVLGDLGIDAP